MEEKPAHTTQSYVPDEKILEDMKIQEKLAPEKPASNSYHNTKRMRPISPPRFDPFKEGSQNSDTRKYHEIMAEHDVENDRQTVKNKLHRVKEERKDKDYEPAPKKKKQDDEESIKSTTTNVEWEDKEKSDKPKKIDSWETPSYRTGTPRRNRWDVAPETPKIIGGETPTPGRWTGPTPMRVGDTPTPSRKGSNKSKWDEPPTASAINSDKSTDSAPKSTNEMTPEQFHHWKLNKELEEKNRQFTDEELDQLLPTEGFEIVKAPESYVPIKPGQKYAEPTQDGFYQIPEEVKQEKPIEEKLSQQMQDPFNANALPYIKPEDVGYFSALLNEVDEDKLTPEEQKERKIMMLLLKVKNGTPPMRKQALRTITEKAKDFGPGPLFNQILPLMMSPTLEDQERHLLVKVIDRILYKLDDLVRPFVHKILVVIEPMLIDEDYYARVEGREIISNLAKAAGLPTMIATMRPDIDHSDEYVRNTTSRAFAVAASALGIPALLPFLKAVCQSKKSWQARHTGIKIVQQIAILMGCAILPYLKSLVEIIEHGLRDEQQKIRTITALAISALAESAYPYGIEAFDPVLIPLWEGITIYQGKGLASFLKAIGFIIPLMDSEHACYYTKAVMGILIREFRNPEDEMKKIVLKVLKQCISTEGVGPGYVRETVVEDFFKCFWGRRMAYDKRNAKQLIETTVEVASKVGGAEIIRRIVINLKDESEQMRKITMETIEKIVSALGVTDIDSKLEETLMDGMIYAFHEQVSDDITTLLNGFGTVVISLGMRVKIYIPQICGTIQWRLNNRSAKIRQQAADLAAKIAPAMKICGEDGLLGRMGMILFQNLGEEYPEVLGSILGALKAIVNVIGMTKMTPPIKDLLPRLTPILKNRHEKVQENCIDLVGRIADRGSEFVSAREWMRICFDLLDLLKAHKKVIRRATVNTFGYIAKAIGPQDVLSTLLNNLRVQERQNRVCTTVAIAIVSEICGPFTVIPWLMNEYRVQEMNVQNGVLKSMSFMFEYIGEMSKDFIYAVTPLLEDALTDRDLVHRQTASSAIKHLALGVQGMSCEDALVHLLNFVFPNIFETSPHVINAVLEATEGIRVSLGPARVLMYCIQGLFHPARRIREVYWKIYNNMYIGQSDALTAIFPNFENDEGNLYRRNELEVFL